MEYRSSDNRTIEWDAENRPVSISVNGTEIASFVYDGDGNRIKKLEGGQETVYINRYYEKNLTSGNATSSYYLGSRLVAVRESDGQNDELRFVHQDHLTGTALTTSENGVSLGTIKYYPYGECRNSQANLPTDRLFTGQRLDDSGLYYYGARYYDPAIGRFISPDSIIPDPANPQSFNRYTYCLNNPLKYIDPSGHAGWKPDFTKDDPWEDVPPEYKGYVPLGYNRGSEYDEPDLPIERDNEELEESEVDWEWDDSGSTSTSSGGAVLTGGINFRYVDIERVVEVTTGVIGLIVGVTATTLGGGLLYAAYCEPYPVGTVAIPLGGVLMTAGTLLIDHSVALINQTEPNWFPLFPIP